MPDTAEIKYWRERYLKLLDVCQRIVDDDHKKKPWGIHYRWTKPKTWAAFKEEVEVGKWAMR